MPSPPCCCMNLQLGCRIAGIVQVIYSILVTTLFTVVIVQAGKPKSYFAIFAVYTIFFTKLITGINLIIDSFQRNAKKLNIWFYATLILVLLEVLLSIYSWSGRVVPWVPWAILVGIGMDVYFLWVVRSFIQELHNVPSVHV